MAFSFARQELWIQQPSIFPLALTSCGLGGGIEFPMNPKYPTRLVALLTALLFVVPAIYAKTSGVFRGILVENPQGEILCCFSVRCGGSVLRPVGVAWWSSAS